MNRGNKEMTCIFCQIIAGDIPSFTIYEDEYVKAFLDISQTTKGHTLIVPKIHSDNLLEVSDERIDMALVRGVRKVSEKLERTLGCKGFNIVSNINEVAGQTVFHTHIHLIPKYGLDDGFKQVYTANEPNFEQLGQLQQQIMEVL